MEMNLDGECTKDCRDVFVKLNADTVNSQTDTLSYFIKTGGACIVLDHWMLESLSGHPQPSTKRELP